MNSLPTASSGESTSIIAATNNPTHTAAVGSQQAAERTGPSRCGRRLTTRCVWIDLWRVGRHGHDETPMLEGLVAGLLEGTFDRVGEAGSST